MIEEQQKEDDWEERTRNFLKLWNEETHELVLFLKSEFKKINNLITGASEIAKENLDHLVKKLERPKEEILEVYEIVEKFLNGEQVKEEEYPLYQIDGAIQVIQIALEHFFKIGNDFYKEYYAKEWERMIC